MGKQARKTKSVSKSQKTWINQYSMRLEMQMEDRIQGPY